MKVTNIIKSFFRKIKEGVAKIMINVAAVWTTIVESALLKKIAGCFLVALALPGAVLIEQGVYETKICRELDN